ncbi:hypothetical protein ACX3V1_15640, partial [Escherichia coli]
DVYKRQEVYSDKKSPTSIKHYFNEKDMANHANKKSPTIVKSNARISTAKKISQHRLAYGNKR